MVDSIDVVKFLIQNGAQINAQNKYGHTPLYNAVQKGFLEIAKYLIENGAQVDIRNNKNKTPFDIAHKKNYFEIAKLLLEKKREAADKNPPNNISDKAPCLICFEKRNGLFALIPCGHTYLCELCCYKLKHEGDSKCPNCRKPFGDYMKIFFGEPE